LKLADEFELDLVEISPNAEPPVCKIMDYKKFVYEQKKREKVWENFKIDEEPVADDDIPDEDNEEWDTSE
jgi:hypothetical protein